jgi:hypothetical protein
VVVPPGTRGPVAVSSTMYYQSVEAVAAVEILGNLVDTNGDMVLQPCVLGGACDGRTPSTEPAVVEGSPPVPMVTRDVLVAVSDASGQTADPPKMHVYPAPNVERAYEDTVVKVSFSRPIRSLGPDAFTLTDSDGQPVPARVDAIGPATWGLFPDAIHLRLGATYTAHVKAGVCDVLDACTKEDFAWRFTIAKRENEGRGDTSIPRGFFAASQEPTGDQK